MQLYRMAAYRKWKLISIENRQHKPVSGEDIILLDEDLCELRT